MAKELDDTPWMEYEEESYCPTCGTPWELVRPGKSQPTCICHLICDICGGRVTNHHWGEDPDHPNMAGEWCNHCGPFGALEKYNG